MTRIYSTNSWSGYSKGSQYWNEYWLEDDKVVKYKCSSTKFFDGKENTRSNDMRKIESWNLDDPNMPEWLRKYI